MDDTARELSGWRASPLRFDTNWCWLCIQDISTRSRMQRDLPAPVNIPPQAPEPGQAWRTTSSRSSADILPVGKSHQDSGRIE